MTATRQLSNALANIWPTLEQKHFWRLSDDERNAANLLQHPEDGRPLIEHWSFVPHPTLVKHLTEDGFHRHIVVIDTISSEVYWPVYEFLKNQTANCSSYYTGGSADFICDISLSEDQFKLWEHQLKEVLKKAGVTKLYKNDYGEKALYSIFRVGSSHIVCGKMLGSLAPLSRDAQRKVEGNRGLFELAWRDYRSPGALAQVEGSESKMAEYLDQLSQLGAILCFKVVADVPRYWDTDFTLLKIRPEASDGLVALITDGDEPDLVRPIDDMCAISVVWTPEQSERTLNYLFVNSFDVPGERISWKKRIYDWANSGDAKLDVNIYNYPLEGTVNETPVWLSDYPEFLDRARKYQGVAGGELWLGHASYPLVDTVGPSIGIPIGGLPFHGVTFGTPGTGKTNTDLILAVAAIDHLTNVVVFDAQAGSWSKLPQQIKDRATRIDAGSERDFSFQRIAEIEGLVVVEFGPERLGEMVAAAVNYWSSSDDLVKESGVARQIRHLLVVEEAHNLWGRGTKSDRGLLSILDETWRKGWSVWLSTQRPDQLGLDDNYRAQLLEKLKNRVVHGMDSERQIHLFAEALQGDGHPPTDISVVRKCVRETGRGRALIRAVSLGVDNRPTYLPPIVASIPLIGSTEWKNARTP